MNKKSFKSRAVALILCALMLFTPTLLIGCDSKTAVSEPATWYRGKANIETVTDGKVGDFYIDTDDYKVYQKDTDGKWVLIMEDFGKPGEATAPSKTYVHVRYAKDSTGSDISTDPTGRSYISILTTEKENPEASDFTVWIKFVGDNGQDGSAGASSYTYIAFAEDALGNGFSKTYAAGLKYIGILTTDTEILDVTKDDFADKWIKFVGEDGANGENGLTPYIGYDGYWWTGTEKGQHKFVEVLTESTVENTVGLIGNEYFESYALDMGANQVILTSNYFAFIEKTGYSGIPIDEIQLYAETAGTLTISTVRTTGFANRRAGSTSFKPILVKHVTLEKGLNTVDLGGIVIPEGETLVFGNTEDTAKLLVYRGVNQDDEQGSFAILSETGLYKKTDGIKDKLVIKTTMPSPNSEAIKGLQNTIDTVSEETGIAWKRVNLGAAYLHGKVDAYAGRTVSHITVRAYDHTAGTDTDNVFMTARVVNKNNATLISTHKFYANPQDITATTLGKVLTLTCEDEITVGVDETILFGEPNDTLYWSYITKLPSTPVTGGFSHATVGSNIASVDANGKFNMLAVNVYLKAPTFKEVLLQLEAEEAAGQKLKTLLTGKKVSVVGDSISTYLNVSNNGNANSTIASNKVYYGSGKDPVFGHSLDNRVRQSQTWWQKTINNYGMQLNVNNSFSGSWVTDKRPEAAACNDRAVNLHTNSGVNPDIIATYIGVNDFGTGNRPCNQTFDAAFFTRIESGNYTSPYVNGDYTIPTYFDEGYALMIYKMKNKYPDADIFCFTIPATKGRDGELLQKYNNAIRNIAAHYGFTVVELYGTVLSDNYAAYTGDGLHPSEAGMDIMVRQFAKALTKKYLEK